MRSMSEYVATMLLAIITIVGASIAYYSLYSSINSINKVSEDAYSKPMITLVDASNEYIYLFNFGKESLTIYSPSIEVYLNNTWVNDIVVPPSTLFRVKRTSETIVLKTDHGVAVIKL